MIEKNWKLIIQPATAFVSFTTQEAKERCLRDFYSELPESGEKNHDKLENGFTSLGVELEVEDPPEPSDVIFENLEISESQQRHN